MSDSRPQTGARHEAQYDAFAAEYAAASATSPYNALYDRPAVLALAGDVAGLRVLEVGAAAGHLTEALADRGASVLATDLSTALLELARRRVGDRAEYRVADAALPYDFVPDASVDLVVASLVMHYLRAWGPTLREFHRVLAPGGRLVMSTHHPTMDWLSTPRRESYFATRAITEQWKFGDRLRPVTFYRRPLRAIFGALREAGFVVDVLEEPMPVEECRTHDPKAYERLTTSPRFLYLVASRPPAS